MSDILTSLDFLSTNKNLHVEIVPLIEKSLLQILIILELLIIFYVVMKTLRTVRFLVMNKKLIRNTFSFEASPKVTTSHIVLFGDSTAYGTGSIDQHHSVAGRLAKDYPHAHIDNKAANGEQMQDVAQKLYIAGEQFYDLAIILIGGNDIIFLTPRTSIRRDLEITLTKAKVMTNNNVILVSPMNVGASRMFWFPIDIFYDWRSRALRKVFRSVSKKYDVPLVDLYIPRPVDFLAEYPKLYFSADNIHYNGEGYGYIYEEIKDVIQKKGMMKK